MKQEFSTKWKSSVQPRKQRKYRFNAPLHIKQKLMGSHLSADLRKKHAVRALPVRVGDKVKVMTGQFKGQIGKVERMSRLKERVYVAGAELVKKNGSKSMYPIHPSNVMIVELVQDKRRVAQKSAKKGDS